LPPHTTIIVRNDGCLHAAPDDTQSVAQSILLLHSQYNCYQRYCGPLLPAMQSVIKTHCSLENSPRLCLCCRVSFQSHRIVARRCSKNVRTVSGNLSRRETLSLQLTSSACTVRRRRKCLRVRVVFTVVQFTHNIITTLRTRCPCHVCHRAYAYVTFGPVLDTCPFRSMRLLVPFAVVTTNRSLRVSVFICRANTICRLSHIRWRYWQYLPLGIRANRVIVTTVDNTYWRQHFAQPTILSSALFHLARTNTSDKGLTIL